MKTCIRTLIFLALLMAAGSAQAQQPAWPQSFDLKTRNTAHYAFAVARAGSIVVTVQWTGSPLTIELTRPNGQKISANVGVSPGNLTALATLNDVATGAAWQLDIHPTLNKVPLTQPGHLPRPDPNLFLNAKGTVSVQYPPMLSASDRRGLVPIGTLPKLQSLGELSQVPPVPTPVISSLSKNPMQSGALIISGSGFGSTVGTVTLVLPDGRAGIADNRGLKWSDTSIEVFVPLEQFKNCSLSCYGNGRITVGRGNVSSQPAILRFTPTIVTKRLYMNDYFKQLGDYSLKPAAPPFLSGPVIRGGYISRSWGLTGERGDDRFFISKRLVNGWKVKGVILWGPGTSMTGPLPLFRSTGNANATVVESHPGTDLPYVKVHFFGDAFSSLDYGADIEITGPYGVEAFTGSGYPKF